MTASAQLIDRARRLHGIEAALLGHALLTPTLREEVRRASLSPAAAFIASTIAAEPAHGSVDLVGCTRLQLAIRGHFDDRLATDMLDLATAVWSLGGELAECGSFPMLLSLLDDGARLSSARRNPKAA